MVKMPHWPNLIGYRDIKLGLSRTYELLQRLDNPHDKLPPVLHIAGTNGKGSTIAFIRSILENTGYVVHVGTSPHLVNFNERIVLAGQEIDDDYLYDISERCRIASGDLPITFFEGATIAALLAFSERTADIVLLETGLGGRLDATNVIKKPLQTIITPISLDHQDYLGDTVEKIAYEKAGIIKEQSVCIVSRQDENVLQIIRERAAKLNSEVIQSQAIDKNTILGLKGEHQIINASTAVTSIKNLRNYNVTSDNILSGLRLATWSGRFEKLTEGNLVESVPESKEIWLDGGHNIAAAESIKNYLSKSINKKWDIIWGMLCDKDALKFLEIISPVIASCYCVAIPDEKKSFSSNELFKIAKSKINNAYDSSSVENAVSEIVRKDSGVGNILICGSLYLIGSVLEKNNK